MLYQHLEGQVPVSVTSLPILDDSTEVGESYPDATEIKLWP